MPRIFVAIFVCDIFLSKGEYVKKFNILYIILPILIALVIALASILGVYIMRDKNKKSDYWQMKYDSFKVQNANLSKGQIVFVGDSITDFYPLDDYYADLNLATYNRGIGGDTTGGLLDRMKVSIFDLEPSKIVLMIGVNDIVGGRKNNEYVLNNYDRILKQISQNLPSAEVHCMSLLPICMDIQPYVPNYDIAALNNQILQANTSIEELASNYGYNYHNLNQLVSNEGDSLKSQYTDDGLHLNSAGFEIWTNLLKPFLV